MTSVWIPSSSIRFKHWTKNQRWRIQWHPTKRFSRIISCCWRLSENRWVKSRIRMMTSWSWIILSRICINMRQLINWGRMRVIRTVRTRVKWSSWRSRTRKKCWISLMYSIQIMPLKNQSNGPTTPVKHQNGANTYPHNSPTHSRPKNSHRKSAHLHLNSPQIPLFPLKNRSKRRTLQIRKSQMERYLHTRIAWIYQNYNKNHSKVSHLRRIQKPQTPTNKSSALTSTSHINPSQKESSKRYKTKNQNQPRK
jgi:hypothetical protein